MDFDNKNILVTGGTGSFGKKCIELLLKNYQCKKVVVFSRDELKQHEMRKQGFTDSSLRFFIGDIRDVTRLKRALSEIDIVIHAAALKQVPTCEYNPIEAVNTNILGSKNVIEASLDCGVQKVIALSTDKAVSPINLYGATKLVAEKLFIQANVYRGKKNTRFSCVRYGNVMGSRGSVIPIFLKQKEEGVLTITDPRMTRFWITLEQSVRFVLNSLRRMAGGEVFIPKIPSMKIKDLALAICPDAELKTIGIRTGEKLHEALITKEESRYVLEFEDYFLIQPQFPFWEEKKEVYREGNSCGEDFEYTSDNNEKWLTKEKLKELITRDIEV